MDIVSERSPTSSPPISPIKLTTHGAHCTPPSNFPTWSRASLERAKLVKAIPRDTKDRKIVFEPTGVVLSSTYTQTDANTSTYNAEILQYKSSYENERQNLASLEKKFNFVVVHHEDVMARLRQEVSELKSENKDLNFRLVMTEGQVSSVQSAYSDEYGRLQCSHCKGPVLSKISSKTDHPNVAQNSSVPIKSAKSTRTADEQGEKQLEQKVLLLKEEITKLKTALKDAKLKNTKLSQLVEYQQQQSQRLHHHSDLELSHRPEPPVIPKAPVSDKHRPGNFGHQPLDRMPRIHAQQRSNNNYQHCITAASHHKSDMSLSTEQLNTSASMSSTNGTVESEAERVRAILQLEQLNAQQEQELSQLNQMFMKQQRLPNNAIQMRVNEKLPPIDLDVSPKMDKNFKSPRKKDDIRLPILQPVPPPNRNLTDRQKRAKELHVQRQRNNREFSALL